MVTVRTARAPRVLDRDVSSFSGRRYDHRTARIEPIEFYEQLVERLVAFVVARDAHGAFASHGIDFIQEDDARGRLSSLVKEIAHATGANSHKHFYEFRSAHAKERHARFTCNGFSQECLTGSRWSNEYDATWNTRSQALLAIW